MGITFLGHQGWLVETRSNKLLIDPLYEKMGNGNTQLSVWPNRKLNLESIGKVDAIIISHEHSDHFNIESLFYFKKFLKPDCVYVPDISTFAIKNALRKIGFIVKELSSFEIISLGDIEVVPLPSLKSRLEPDVYSFLVNDKYSGDSFYTPIDTVPSELAISYLADCSHDRLIYNYTNNFVQRIFHIHNLPQNIYKNSFNFAYKFLQKFIEDFKPKNMLISGGGWSYPKEIDIHNEIMFNVSHEALLERARIEYKDIIFNVAEMGTEYNLTNNGRIKPSKKQKNFIIWVEQNNRKFDAKKFHGYKLMPYCLRAKEYLEMESAVIDFVENKLGKLVALGATKLNKALYYLKVYPEDALKGFYFELMEGDKSFQYEYSYSDSKFYPLKKRLSYTQAKRRYAFGLIGFMYDFYQIILAREEAHLISENSMYVWNNRDDLLEEPTDVDFMQCFRPQYRPEEFEKFYLSEIEKYATKF